ncbi:MAG TPA: selenium cofactor biosynthesis protein YqeC [Vicinamibacteria bacterium]|nr:selenium cofactor biosynthesis protein YqeC [Vicinamibacteria bacterium]
MSVGRGDIVSVVGAGGKTTLVYALAIELRKRGLSVVVTSTTHMQMPPRATTAPPLVVAEEEDNWLTTLKTRIARYGAATLVERRQRDDKLEGIDVVTVDPLRSLADTILIEADGARSRSLKTPAAHEPVVPDETTIAVVLAGMDVLGSTLDEEHVHRLDHVLRLTGAARGDRVSETIIADCIIDGYLPRLPRRARPVVLLNKASEDRLQASETLARMLVDRGAAEVLFGEALKPHQCFYRVKAHR